MASTAQVRILGDQLNVAAQRVERLNQEVLEAQNELLNKQAKLNQIKGTSPEGLSEVQMNSSVSTLKQTCNAAEQEYAEKSKIYKPDYPGMQQSKVKRDQACGAYRREVNFLYGKVLQQAQADVNATAAKQSTLKSQFNTAGPEVKGGKIGDYELLKGEVENERKLLEQLSQQRQTAQLTTESGGMQLNALMRIVDYATPPRASVRPRRVQSMTLAFLFGLLGGTGLALLINFLDTKVHSHEDIEKNTSFRFLTFIPEMEKEVDEQMNRNAFRFLNKFLFAQKLKDGRPKILLVTSAEPAEGKSFVASNLAITIALEGKSVVLFDMDVHRPTVHRAFDISRKPGMGDLLMNSSNPDFEKYPRIHKHLTVVPGGDGVTQHLVTSLEGPRLDQILQAAAREYDCVILDTGPMLVTPETLTIAQKVDGVILVVRSNQTPVRILRMTEEVFRKMKIRVLGVVLNRVSLTDLGSYYHYNNPYRHYYSYYNLPIAKDQ
jgi:capsular exopolysaccharide synthesis family protein